MASQCPRAAAAAARRAGETGRPGPGRCCGVAGSVWL